MLCLVFFSCVLSLKAQSVVLFTGHLNADCIADTVKGKSVGLHEYVPDVIVWGQPSLHHCPDTVQGGHAPGTPFVPMTKLMFAGWSDLHVSTAFQRYNQNDSLDDVIFYLWGTYQNAQGVWRDTARAVVIFGQKDLDLQPVVLVQGITAGFQSTPFFAMDLQIGRNLVDPQERDLTGEISYELLPATAQVMPPDTNNPHPIHTVQDSLLTTVTVYPNPTELWAKMQADPLEPGEYTISIMAVNGSVYHTQTVQIGEGKHLERELDLRSLPSGYYVVRLHTNSHYVGSYPIVIVR